MRIGVDVGGTFTDLILDAGDELRVAKVPSTSDDQSRGVLNAVDGVGVLLDEVGRFAHGTTVATNTVLERDGARTVLVTTAGFRDLLEIGRQDRPGLYDQRARRPAPLVPRDRVVEAAERLGADGSVIRTLDDPEAVAQQVAALEPEAVAICLLFSFRDDRHEVAIAEAVEAAGVDVPVTRSSALLPVFREYERASTTVLNAYVAPRVARYVTRLEERLASAGMACTLEVMRSSGGTATASQVTDQPVHTLLSGPAAGAWGAAAVADRSGHPDVIAFDMGGTSTDVTLIDGARPTTAGGGEIGGLPFAVRTTDIHTVGAGGGSIAWVDDGGALRVGPRSAGAEPGPAAYGRGGAEPTVTDAHVVLGRLAPDDALGSGAVRLDVGAARDVVGRLADRLGMDLEACARGIVRVADANIVRALRVVSVERGRDPRAYALVAFGGAGPLHQASVARELGCGTVIVPPHAGVLAAVGLLAAPVTADAVRTRMIALSGADPGRLTAGWQDLEREAAATLERQDVPVDRVHRSADLRYRGQAHELEIAGDDPDPTALAEAFHEGHEQRFGYAQPDEPVELVNLRVRVEGPPPEVPLPEIGRGTGADNARSGSRRVVVEEGRAVDCPIYVRSELGAGDRIDGPAIVAGIDTTCLVVEGQLAEVDRIGSLVITEAGGA